jgi:hypothetical protein
MLGSLLSRAGACLPLGALLALSTGCPPNLTGASCVNDCNCPRQQVCSAAHCIDGIGNDCGTLGDAGIDGGTDAGLGDGGPGYFAGLVRLNHGIDKPTGRSAWVYGWTSWPDLSSGIPSGHVLFTATNANGTFVFTPPTGGFADAGIYFLAQYDLDGDGRPDVLTGDAYSLNPHPFFPSDPGSTNINLDVETSSCFSFTTYNSLTGATYLEALAASIPDIDTGQPLAASLVLATAAVLEDGGTFSPLTFQTNPLNANLDGTFAYLPATTTTLPSIGVFTFVINAQGYSDSAYGCTLDYHDPTGATPVGLTLNGFDGGAVIPVWNRAASNEFEWTSAPQSAFDLVTVFAPDGTILYPDAPRASDVSPLFLSGGIVPAGVCDADAGPTPIPKLCRIRAASFFKGVRGHGSFAYEGIDRSLQFVTSP